MEEKSGGKSKEYIKELDLYEEVKELNRQLHSAQAQLESANAQHHQWLQEKERLMKENNELKQKIKQEDENVSSTLTQIETCQKQIETCQQQLKEKKEEVSRLNDEISHLMEITQGRVLRTNEEEKYYRLFLGLRDIVYDAKIDNWVSSSLRFMERTDFENFVNDLRAIFEEEEKEN